MIKLICDNCNNEIKETTEFGNFVLQEKVIIWNEKHQNENRLKKTEYLFCLDCSRELINGLNAAKTNKSAEKPKQGDNNKA